MDDLKSRVTKTFDDWASWYDEYFGGWMKYSTNMVLSEIDIPEIPICLDVACGTGVSTFELMKICNNNGTFYGMDISENMIEAANNIASDRGLNNVEFICGDAESIEFPDSTFDLILCNMSLHFFPNKLRPLKEMCRVLKPGGQYAFTYTGKPNRYECMEIAQEVAASYPNLLGFSKAIADTENWPIGLEESIDLLESAGLIITNIYERRNIDYVDPSFIVSERNTIWHYWQQMIPVDMINTIKEELVNVAKKVVSDRGFKSTTIVIFARGKKL